MKIFAPAASAAIAAGTSLDVGAIKIACTPPVRVWGGYGQLTIGSDTFEGLGDRALVAVTGGALGVGAEGSEVRLSRSDAPVETMLDAPDLWRAPVTVWRLIFDQGGRNVLDAQVHQRGRVDDVEEEAVAGGTTNLVVKVEGAAKGQGRTTGRMRADADQRLIEVLDGGFRAIAAFAEKQLVWGGRRPARAGGILGRWAGGGLFNLVTGQVRGEF